MEQLLLILFSHQITNKVINLKR